MIYYLPIAWLLVNLAILGQLEVIGQVLNNMTPSIFK
jgi:hypothetical protein